MTTGTTSRDVVIIGAGAAGLMCAIAAGRRGRSVLLLDHGDRSARKVRISGGGRCNFSNVDVRAEHYISANPHFCKSALARFTPGDFVALLETRGIAYRQEEEGKLFCRGSAGDIVAMLEAECRGAGGEIRLACRVDGVTRGDDFRIATSKGVVKAGALVVATGGLSFPELGATDLGFRLAGQFGLRVVPPRPALAPFILSAHDRNVFGPLSGLSLPVRASCRGATFSGMLLLTHRGASGPAMLQLSSYWSKGDEVVVDLLPGKRALDLLMERRDGKMELATLLSHHLPKRFVHAWCDSQAPSRPLRSYSDKELAATAALLHRWILRPEATEGYRKAEVTAGGVDTDELSSKTMECRKVPGLFFVGEVVDVTGQLGGYNLQWAWSSGFAAGRAV